MEHPVLETHGLTIRFGGHFAVSSVSCAFAPGTLTAIVGPNGAGKTTYFNLISGQLKATSGRVSLYGEDITGLPAFKRVRRGIAYTFQITSIYGDLTVAENVALAAHGAGGARFLDRVGLANRASESAGTLAYGHQRLLEVAMGLALGCGALTGVVTAIVLAKALGGSELLVRSMAPKSRSIERLSEPFR